MKFVPVKMLANNQFSDLAEEAIVKDFLRAILTASGATEPTAERIQEEHKMQSAFADGLRQGKKELLTLLDKSTAVALAVKFPGDEDKKVTFTAIRARAGFFNGESEPWGLAEAEWSDLHFT